MSYSSDFVDKHLPFVLEWWSNGHWRPIGRFSGAQFAVMVKDALKVTQPKEDYRVLEVRWHRVAERVDV